MQEVIFINLTDKILVQLRKTCEQDVIVSMLIML